MTGSEARRNLFKKRTDEKNKWGGQKETGQTFVRKMLNFKMLP
jgi:hypothetical protein